MGFILGVKTCDVFLCCAAIVLLLCIVLLSLFSLIYVSGELHRFFAPRITQPTSLTKVLLLLGSMSILGVRGKGDEDELTGEG